MTSKTSKSNILVIDRAKWLNGRVIKDTCYDSVLYSKEYPLRGMMCCLGFYGRSVGVPVAKLRNTCYLEPVGKCEWLGAGERKCTPQQALVDVNDDASLSNRDREQKLKQLFKQHGIIVKFVGKAAKSVRA